MAEIKTVEIYTAVWMRSGNPGWGAYGIVLSAGKHQRELNGGYQRSTQERLALTAMALALETLKIPAQIKLYTPSITVAELLAGGQAARWREHRWQNRGTERIENADLWERVLKAADQHQLSVIADRGDLSAGRSRALDLAQAALGWAELPADATYEALTKKAPEVSQPSLF